MAPEVVRSDEEWREKLSPEEYRIAREKGTEPAFTGKYYRHNADGTYLCIGCGAELFRSSAKYESGSGWPSFYEPVDHERVATETDLSHGMRRTEILCSRCGSHLGHVFDDGPAPTGLRYCVNSASLDFRESADVQK
jgi:peptide-methionine (R)-S-oxide reductase